MSRRVIVVGWGVAGLAAAYAAAERGAHVALVGEGAGATSLCPGAVDDVDWSEREAAAAVVGAPLLAPALDDEVRAFVSTVTDWDLAQAGQPLPRLVATTGIVRTARGRDPALLDLGSVGDRTVLVPRAPRASWDADALVASLRDEAPGVAFEAIGAPVLRFADEARIADADLAARHDDDARLAWLAARLAPHVERAGRPRAAVLLGPWLGLAAGRAQVLAARLGCPVGEAMASQSLVAGLRFERARDRWLARSGIELVRARAVGFERTGEVCRVSLRGAPALEADVVILATGGLVGGGLVYDPPEHRAAPDGPEHVRAPFRVRFPIDGVRVGDGVAAGVASSVFGPVLDHAWPRAGAAGSLERAGVLAGPDRAAAPGVFVAGDVAASEHRTVLAAVHAGLDAGARAAAIEAGERRKTALFA